MSFFDEMKSVMKKYIVEEPKKEVCDYIPAAVAAVRSIEESAKRMAYSSDKVGAAEQIRDICLFSMDNDVLCAAVAALSNIRDQCSFSSDKSDINEFIRQIIVKND